MFPSTASNMYSRPIPPPNSPLRTGSRNVRATIVTPERVDILGVGVSAINMDMALSTMDHWVTSGQKHYVCVTGVHGVIESQTDPKLRRIFNQAGLVTPDGMPMVWVNWLKKQRHVGRVYGPDLMTAICEISAAKGYRHFLYGGAPDVPEKLTNALRKTYPGIEIVGAYSPPFRPLTPDEDDAVVRQINESGPDFVWVGLSTPKQEYWMADHAGRIDAAAMIGVGAAFDFLSGAKTQAPRWIQRGGFEWLYRLITEPRRLWRRYLTIVPLFLLYMALDSVGLRRRETRAF